MKKPFFHSCVPGTSGVSGERSFEANFDATNVVTDASCEPNYGATVVRDGSAQEGNTLSTLGGNPEPPEASLWKWRHYSLFTLSCLIEQLQDDGAPSHCIGLLETVFADLSKLWQANS